jgi:hypothetical protein
VMKRFLFVWLIVHYSINQVHIHQLLPLDVFGQDYEDEVNHYVDHHRDNVDGYHRLHKVGSVN